MTLTKKLKPIDMILILKVSIVGCLKSILEPKNDKNTINKKLNTPTLFNRKELHIENINDNDTDTPMDLYSIVFEEFKFNSFLKIKKMQKIIYVYLVNVNSIKITSLMFEYKKI